MRLWDHRLLYNKRLSNCPWHIMGDRGHEGLHVEAARQMEPSQSYHSCDLIFIWHLYGINHAICKACPSCEAKGAESAEKETKKVIEATGKTTGQSFLDRFKSFCFLWLFLRNLSQLIDCSRR